MTDSQFEQPSSVTELLSPPEFKEETASLTTEMCDQNSIDLNNPQVFCLRWNNYQSNLTSVFEHLLQKEQFVDVTLSCEGCSIKAHKMVLSACSPYFQALFNDNPCKHPIVILRDIRFVELKGIIEFMYRGEINVSQEEISPLLRVAELLKIRGLADVNADHKVEMADTSERTLMEMTPTTEPQASTSNDPSSAIVFTPQEYDESATTSVKNRLSKKRKLDFLTTRSSKGRKRKSIDLVQNDDSNCSNTVDNNSFDENSLNSVQHRSISSPVYKMSKAEKSLTEDAISELVIDEDKVSTNKIFIFF